VQTLSPAGQDAFDPQIAMSGAGDAVVVWTRFDGANDRIQARARSVSGTLSSVQTLSGSLQDAEKPQVGIDGSGNAVAVWERSDGTNLRVQTRARLASGTLSSVQTLTAAGQDAFAPQVAVNTAGTAAMLWTRFDGTHDRTQLRTRSSAGVLSSVETISDAGHDAEEPQVGIDGNGNATGTWERFDGTSFRIQARLRSAAGVLDPVQTISTAGLDAFSPQIAVNGPGAAFADWLIYDSSGVSRVQAAAGP
jgi:hypothetical protein